MRASDLDLRELLAFEPKGGIIRFANERVLLVDAVALGLLRRELIDTLGVTGARAQTIDVAAIDGGSHSPPITALMNSPPGAADDGIVLNGWSEIHGPAVRARAWGRGIRIRMGGAGCTRRRGRHHRIRRNRCRVGHQLAGGRCRATSNARDDRLGRRSRVHDPTPRTNALKPLLGAPS